VHLIRDVLDQQILDRDDVEIGRVDGILVELRPNAPPRVVSLEVGFVPLARRISRRLERFAEAMHKRLGVRRSARYGIPWSSVLDVKPTGVETDLCADDTVAYDWERWLRANVVARMPGASQEDE
jgi:hypothetical protein